ncbi:hypothetical protein [Shewanella atlantica]|uniref:Uncharacterized protein n=1 Tax=Shewanella atlantica TaxID=271099 RepID=A0A3S0L3A7_9GAMM|nr:hypothetical protein [Shewanella atlantica]RTR25994.1 hypothetical protein EKG39_22655 [Shewanella atlantica]
MKSIFNALCSKGLPTRDLKNANRVNLLAVLWALSLLIGSLLSQYYSLSALVISLAFIIHTLIGIAMAFAFKRFLGQLDEMERKIQLDALALAVGVGMTPHVKLNIAIPAICLAPLLIVR